MKTSLLGAAIAFSLIAVLPAKAASLSVLAKREHRQQATLWKDHGTVRFFRHHPALARTEPGRRALRYARAEIAWTARQLARVRADREARQRRELLASRSPSAVKAWVERTHPCLAGIIAGENRSYDPTLDFGGGHGNVYEAYGIPQALPGTKMAAAGPDWRTNPWTQIRWMIGYVVSRYGSECAALDFKRRVGSY